MNLLDTVWPALIAIAILSRLAYRHQLIRSLWWDDTSLDTIARRTEALRMAVLDTVSNNWPALGRLSAMVGHERRATAVAGDGWSVVVIPGVNRNTWPASVDWHHKVAVELIYGEDTVRLSLYDSWQTEAVVRFVRAHMRPCDLRAITEHFMTLQRQQEVRTGAALRPAIG